MLAVSGTAVFPHNQFDLSVATVGWVDETHYRPDNGFFTGAAIAVTPGDELTFGAAVTTQGWHFMVYDREKTPLIKGTVANGIRVLQQLDEETSVMQYTLPPGAAFVRMVTDSRYSHRFWVTVNRPFTAQEYREYMARPATVLFTVGKQRQEWSIWLNITGRGRMQVEEKTLPFGPGTVVCVPPGAWVTKESPEGFQDLQVVSRQFLPGERVGNQVAVLEDDGAASLQTLMGLMRRVLWTQAEDARLLQQLYETVEQSVLRRLSQEHRGHQPVQEMIRRIRTDFAQPDFSLEQVFVREPYCQTHLCRLFKEETGCTPLEYLMTLRVEHAKKLMKENRELQATVAQIAFLSGFRDPCYFSRVFKKKTGLSPLQYMKKFFTEDFV